MQALLKFTMEEYQLPTREANYYPEATVIQGNSKISDNLFCKAHRRGNYETMGLHFLIERV